MPLKLVYLYSLPFLVNLAYLVYNIMVESDCPGEQCGVLDIKCMDNPDSIYIIQSHDFCIQDSDIGGDRFTFTIYPDSVGCNSIDTDCNID